MRGVGQLLAKYLLLAYRRAQSESEVVERLRLTSLGLLLGGFLDGPLGFGFALHDEKKGQLVQMS